MSYGFLAKRPYLHENWPFAVTFDGVPPPTRPEEYFFVLDNLGTGRFVLDAACGWRPDWHILPELMVDNTHPGTQAELAPLRFVVAMDANPEVMYNFPPHPQIARMMGDLCGMPFADNQFATVVCISVIEHLPPTYQYRAMVELCRVARERVVITADISNPEILAEFVKERGFDVGSLNNQEGDILLNEKGVPVSYMVAVK